MRRPFLILLLWLMAASSGCHRKESRSEAPPPGRTKQVPRPPVAPNKPPPKAPAPDTPKPPVPRVLYHFYDGCWDAKAATPAKARKRCRRLGRKGQSYHRLGCKCKKGHLITVRSTDPVKFYYMSGEVFAVASNPAIVRKRCAEEKARDLKRGVAADYDCATAKIRKAHGPYKRAWTFSDFDDPESFVYLDHEDGSWMDDNGEPPCFPAGTRILTPGGAVPIERVRRGDLLVSWDPVLGQTVQVKVTEARPMAETMVGRVTLDGGATLELTRNHPVFSPGSSGWAQAGTLGPHDQLVTRQDGHVTVANIRAVAWGRRAVVYRLSVSAPHTYFANNVLVHNY